MRGIKYWYLPADAHIGTYCVYVREYTDGVYEFALLCDQQKIAKIMSIEAD